MGEKVTILEADLKTRLLRSEWLILGGISTHWALVGYHSLLASCVLMSVSIMLFRVGAHAEESTSLLRRAVSVFAMATSFTWFGLFSCDRLSEAESKALAILCNVGPIRMETSLCDYPVVQCGLPFRSAVGHCDYAWSRERGIPVVFTNAPLILVFSQEQGLYLTLGNVAALMVALSVVAVFLPERFMRLLPLAAGLLLLMASPASFWWLQIHGSWYV